MVSPLVGKRASIVDAEHTLKLALSAAHHEDRRLAVSRAITAAVQAATASIGKPQEVVERAERVIQAVRQLVQGIVIENALSGVAGNMLPRWASEDPWIKAKGMVSAFGTFKNRSKKIREEFKSQRATIMEDLRRKLLSMPVEAPQGPFHIDDPSMWREAWREVSVPREGRPWMILSPEPTELWSHLSDELPTGAAIVSGPGVIVAPNAVNAASISLAKLVMTDPAQAATIIDPAVSLSVMSRFEDAVRSEFDATVKTAVDKALLEEVAKSMRISVEDATRLRQQSIDRRDSLKQAFQASRGFVEHGRKVVDAAPAPEEDAQ